MRLRRVQATLPSGTLAMRSVKAPLHVSIQCPNSRTYLRTGADARRTHLDRHHAVRPSHYFPAHSCVSRSLTFVRIPPLQPSLDGSLELDDGEPTMIASTGYDGSVILTDLRDVGQPMIVTHERGTYPL